MNLQTFVALGALLFTLPSLASESVTRYLERGNYEGTGKWTDGKGGGARYEVETAVHSMGLTTTYRMPDEDGTYLTVTDVFYFYALKDPGHFELFSKGSRIGEAKCQAQRCDLEFWINRYLNKEKISFDEEGRMIRAGIIPETGVSWVETLPKKKTPSGLSAARGSLY